MAYTWTGGEVITAEKLNQTGGGSSGNTPTLFVVNLSYDEDNDSYSTDKTGLEIYEAYQNGQVPILIHNDEEDLEVIYTLRNASIEQDWGENDVPYDYYRITFYSCDIDSIFAMSENINVIHTCTISYYPETEYNEVYCDSKKAGAVIFNIGNFWTSLNDFSLFNFTFNDMVSLGNYHVQFIGANVKVYTSATPTDYTIYFCNFLEYNIENHTFLFEGLKPVDNGGTITLKHITVEISANGVQVNITPIS